MATTTDFLRVEEDLTAIHSGINASMIQGESSTQPHKRKRVETIEGSELSDNEDVNNNDDYEDNDNDGGQELTKGDCGCENKSAIMTRIAAARKRGFTDQNKLRNDIEFLSFATVNKMC